MAISRKLAIAVMLLFAISEIHAQGKPDTLNVIFTTIDVPGAVYTGANGINKAGVVVGSYGEDPSVDSHGFTYSSGTFTYFDYPDGQNWTIPRGINDSGLIVGYADRNPVFGFLYDGTTFTTLQDGSNSATETGGINNAGIIVGGAGTIYTTRAFESRNARYKSINFPGNYVYGYASGINNFGGVVGTADAASYFFKNGGFQSIQYPGATQTSAQGINDSGVITGWYLSSSCDCSFVYYKGDYMSFSYPGAAFTAAAGINASGQVVGEYTFDFQTYHGFVTSPITAEAFR